MLNRREFIAAVGAITVPGLAVEAPVPRGVPLRVEPLAFPIDALEPYFDAPSLRHHHDDYHTECLSQLIQTLDRLHLTVANVVSLMPSFRSLVQLSDSRSSRLTLTQPPADPISIEAIVAIRKFGGAHINHTAFWRFLAPVDIAKRGPQGDLKRAIRRNFGNVTNLKKAFSKAAIKQVGSGWAWLSYRNDGTLFVSTTANEDNPLMNDVIPWHQQGKPILCLDLWEHAYLHRYHEDRHKYIDAWWNVVNWPYVERAYAIVTAQR